MTACNIRIRDSRPETEGSRAVAVSVVVPVDRNAETLVPLYERLVRALAPVRGDFELVFVVDGCPAGSLAAARALAAHDARVRVVALPQNGGQHRAVMAGLAVSCGATVVVMDADLQDPPEAVPMLLAELARSGASAIFAGRRGRYESAGRLATSRVFKRALHAMTGVPIDAGMFVALGRPLVATVLAMPVTRPFLVAMIGCANVPVASVPVERAVRTIGRSGFSSWKRLTTALSALHLVARHKLAPIGWARGRA